MQIDKLINAINKLKKERNIAILTHNYQTPEIFHCVSGKHITEANHQVNTITSQGYCKNKNHINLL